MSMIKSFYKVRDDASDLFKKNSKNISKRDVLPKELDVCNVRWLIGSVALTVAFYMGCMPETAKAPEVGRAAQKTQPNRPPEYAQAGILAALQEQNRLMQLEREEAQAEKKWVAEREKHLQDWASFKANEHEQLDKITFDSDVRQAEDQARIDGLSGRAKIPSFRRWWPTYGKWYPKYLEEYRKICGTLTKDDLMNFARTNSLMWINPPPWEDDREFFGIGLVWELNSARSGITVLSSVVGSPSWKSGIQQGDQITRIDGKSTADMTLKQAVELLRGQRGTSVRLDVVSHSSPISSPIPREIVLERVRVKVESK